MPAMKRERTHASGVLIDSGKHAGGVCTAVLALGYVKYDTAIAGISGPRRGNCRSWRLSFRNQSQIKSNLRIR